jgi:hypothetical protein
MEDGMDLSVCEFIKCSERFGGLAPSFSEDEMTRCLFRNRSFSERRNATNGVLVWFSAISKCIFPSSSSQIANRLSVDGGAVSAVDHAFSIQLHLH